MDKSYISHTKAENHTAEEKRAEDIAYTINHAIACTLSDFGEPYLNSWFHKQLGVRFPIGCNHAGHENGCDQEHGSHGNLKHWYIGEIVGDFAAVPLTIATQVTAPWFMEGLRTLSEPLIGGFFMWGAKNSAASWAKKNGIDPDSPECLQKAHEIYEHEMSHVPNALLWTASSVAINMATQKALGNTSPLWQMGAAKALGSSVSSSALVAARAIAPQTAESWDHFTTKNIFLPITKTIGQTIGIDQKIVERVVAKESAQNWAERVSKETGNNNNFNVSI